MEGPGRCTINGEAYDDDKSWLDTEVGKEWLSKSLKIAQDNLSTVYSSLIPCTPKVQSFGPVESSTRVQPLSPSPSPSPSSSPPLSWKLQFIVVTNTKCSSPHSLRVGNLRAGDGGSSGLGSL